jgi:lysophospholipid acyltransferase (LPLAT)-like uncharacterized protein
MKKFLRLLGKIFIPFLLYVLMRFIWFTTRKTYHFITEMTEAQHVCVTWHGELLMTPQAYRKIHPKHKSSAIITSNFDGS